MKQTTQREGMADMLGAVVNLLISLVLAPFSWRERAMIRTLIYHIKNAG